MTADRASLDRTELAGLLTDASRSVSEVLTTEYATSASRSYLHPVLGALSAGPRVVRELNELAPPSPTGHHNPGEAAGADAAGRTPRPGCQRPLHRGTLVCRRAAIHPGTAPAVSSAGPAPRAQPLTTVPSSRPPEPPVSDATALEQADALIEKAWGRPIDVLETLAVRRPVEDPLLRSAMHIRSSLVVSNNAVAVHQDRLHALTRPGHVPAFYDLERITSSAVDLRVAQTESRIALQAISHVIEAREAAVTADQAPSLSLAQAAVARSAHAPRALGQPPDQPAQSAAVGATMAVTVPRR
ncbi:hypothetical protein [Streptomyces sp. NPDC002671]